MKTISLVKNAGYSQSISAIHEKSTFHYGTDFNGAATGVGLSSDEIHIFIEDAASQTDADAILSAVALPTCTDSGLDITSNFGTWIVNDVDSITADPTDTKFIKITIAIDDTTGDLEVIVFEKLNGVYGDMPAGKTFVCDLKEYSLVANGSTLTELSNGIK